MPLLSGGLRFALAHLKNFNFVTKVEKVGAYPIDTFLVYIYVHLLACLFRRKSQAIVITRSLLCKNFMVAHNSKSIKKY